MRCHYVIDKGVRVLIPGCLGMAVYDEWDHCTCSNLNTDRIQRLEKRVERIEKQLVANQNKS